MISPMYYAKLCRYKNVTPTDLKAFDTITFNPHELIELKALKRDDLLGLMLTLGIREFQGLPVIACSNDELRSAYLVFRGSKVHQAKQRETKTAKKWFHTINTILDDWMDEF